MYYLCHLLLLLPRIFGDLLFLLLPKPYTSRLDTYPPKRHLAFRNSQRPFSFQFVDISRPRFEKHGFDRRHQGRGAFFGFDGEGEEAEE